MPGSSSVPIISSTSSEPTSGPMSAMKSGVPQRAQNPRSAMSELAQRAGRPCHSTPRAVTSGAKTLPAARWHIRQWQMLACPSGSVTR